MRNLRRVMVVSERGRLVGVYVPPDSPPADPRAPVANLRVGPGQKIREIELEVAQPLKSAREVEAFHAALRKKLKLRK